MNSTEPATFIQNSNTYSVNLINETTYTPDSADNTRSYTKVYFDKPYDDYPFLTKHGIFITYEGQSTNSACICSSGGPTSIHSTCLILETDRILVCCASSVFCLTVPDLNLSWVTNADDATCFEIFKYMDDYIVHGELEISRLNRKGEIIWKFWGSDIFTTPTGENAFIIERDRIQAADWQRNKFVIDIQTGKAIVTS